MVGSWVEMQGLKGASLNMDIFIHLCMCIR